MTVKEITSDPENLTLTCVAEFAAPRARVWRVWSEKDLVGQWWGPPGWPATFVRYEFEPGGTAHYFMQGPDGSKHYGGWTLETIDAPNGLSLEDYFADEAGTPNPELPTSHLTMTLTEMGGITTMRMVSRFGSLEQLEQLVGMGVVEGLRGSLSQIDGLL